MSAELISTSRSLEAQDGLLHVAGKESIGMTLKAVSLPTKNAKDFYRGDLSVSTLERLPSIGGHISCRSLVPAPASQCLKMADRVLMSQVCS